MNKFENLLWSGCSHSFGSGIINENLIFENDFKFKFSEKLFNHERLIEFFKPCNSKEDLLEQLNWISYPGVVAKELNFSNYYNLSIGGSGITTQSRLLFSFIEKNKNKIDLNKTLFVYQIPSYVRIEIINTRDGYPYNFETFNFQTIEEEYEKNNEFAIHYFKNHYDINYSLSVFLQQLLFLKKYVESYGITFLPFFLADTKSEDDILNKFKYTQDENHHSEIINSFNKVHVFEKFPMIKDLVKNIDFWQIDINQPFGDPKTLWGEGFNQDNHYSPNGHEILGKNLAYHLKNKFNI